jgi:hypothetical protein
MSHYYSRALSLRDGKSVLPPLQRELVDRLRAGFGIEALYVHVDVTSSRDRQFLEIVVPTIADADRCRALPGQDRLVSLFLEVIRSHPDDPGSEFRLVPAEWLTQPKVNYVSLEKFAALRAVERLRQGTPEFLETIRSRFPASIASIDEMGPLHFAVFMKGPVESGIREAFVELLRPHAPPGWVTSAALDLEFPDEGTSALDFYR